MNIIKSPFGQEIEIPDMYSGYPIFKRQDAAGNLKFFHGEKEIGRWSRLHGATWADTLIGRMMIDRETGRSFVVSVSDWNKHMELSSVSSHYFSGFSLLGEDGQVEKSF